VLVALIGYLGAMVMALAALVAAWFVVVGPPPQHEARQPPPAIGAVTRTATSEQKPQSAQPGPWGPAVVHRADEGAPAATDDAGAAAEQAAAAEKAKQLKLARYRKRKEQEARQREEQSYPTALGYDREGARDRSPPPVLYQFGPRRY